MTPEPLHRLVYDATIDDAVDVGMRLANRSGTYQRQVRQNILIAGGIGACIVIGVAIYNLNEPGPFELALTGVFALAFAVPFALVFKHFFLKEISKQSRKVFTEQFGGKPTVPCELELRPDAVWTRQAGTEIVFPWTLCTGIQDNPDDIELSFSAGICVVRNRHLPSPAERARFLETARRLSGK